ncbi:heavy-metal-associated domain-containing protein [Streptomyces sp. MST-110588]|uniref:heavy-metal-associated domain-containing protein n=1 Tax=Streptomyces sp. MST-110588 TaxID=2833628 RepID=UPI001F5DCACE|nr:heavy-metal-associated domain-containing protein [Streptomyces sp. MST-110588]UNO41933.1 heavy-metal-associated domain-containing protein [Streptomyces sp. MST-110588]
MTENSSCCTPEGSCHSGSAAEAQAGEVQANEVTTTYKVSGMTCGHCEGAVSSEISEIPGVRSVKAEATTGLVTVVSAAPLDEEAVRAAVDEAGYELAGQAA